MALRLSTTARNAAADAVVGLIDAGAGPGKIEIRSGAQPATPQAAATGTLLATVVLADPASGAASAGTDTIANPTAVNGVADGGAFPYWARFLDSNNVVVMDCSVTQTGGGGDITLSAQITNGVSVDMDAITYSQPQG